MGIIFFAGFLHFMHHVPTFHGDTLEVVVLGGIILGMGLGIIIKNGGCSDGSEILAIIVNRTKGFTIGQVVVVINVFIFVIEDFPPSFYTLFPLLSNHLPLIQTQPFFLSSNYFSFLSEHFTSFIITYHFFSMPVSLKLLPFPFPLPL